MKLKKKHILLAIPSITLGTLILLVVIFVRHYQPTPKPVVPNEEQNQVVENGDVSDDPTLPEDETPEDPVEPTEPTEPEVKPLEFVTSDKSYFDDALFIGDSRTVGIKEYGDLGNITYFATEGLNVYDLWKDTVSVKGMGSNYLEHLIKAKDYKKIYIMIGINELGYDQGKTANKYKETLDKLHALAPDAIIYVCSNLHVTATQSSKNETFNNVNIDKFNETIKAFTDHETFFYLDVNELFNDGYGNLREDYTSDNVHILAKYYAEWAEWFCQKTIVKE